MKKSNNGKRPSDYQWSSFVESFEDLKRLKSKYDKSVTLITSVIAICPAKCLRYYLRQIASRTFYVIERCKLLQDGKCYRKYQYEVEEADHLVSESSDRRYSFDQSENDDTKITAQRAKRLTFRSVAGMKYTKTLNKAQKLQLDDISREVDSWLIEVYSAFEGDVANELYVREGVNKNYQLKCRNSCIIDVRFSDKYFQKHKTELPAIHRVKGKDVPAGNIIWFTTDPKDFQCFSEKWNSYIIDEHLPLPLADNDAVVFDHNAALRDIEESVAAAERIDNSSSSSSKGSKPAKSIAARASGVDTQKISSENARMGLGSRLLKKSSTHDNHTPAAPSAFLVHTPDGDRLTKGASKSTPIAYSKQSAGGMESDHLSVDSSVKVAARRRSKNYKFIDTDNWVDSDDDSKFPTPYERSKRKLADTTNDDDHDYETAKNCGPLELHKSSSKKANRQHNLQKAITNRLQQTENESEVRVTMYKKSNINIEGGDVDFIGDIQADLCSQRVSDALTAFNYPSTITTTSTASDETDSTATHLSVYSGLSTRAKAAMNSELDESFIMFLVYHTTSAIGAEIALELCIVNYIMRKELLNGVSSREKQIITNWKDIFLSIESLIVRKINCDSNEKRNVFETACMGSIDKFTQEREDRIVRVTNLEESSSDSERNAELHRIEELYDHQIAQLKRQLKELIGEIDKAETSVLRKVVRTLFSVARKVCYMWAQFNDCLSLLSVEQRNKYAKYYATRDHLQKDLKFAQDNKLLYLRTETENTHPNFSPALGDAVTETVSAMPPHSSLNEEQNTIHKILEKNHVQELEQVIRGISVDKEKMKDLVSNVMWVKTPRNCTSLAKALSPLKNSTASATKAASNPKKQAVEEASVVVEPPSAASVANLANFLKSGQSATTVPDTGSVYSTTSENQWKFARSYDSVIRILLLDLHAATDHLCMHLHYRFKSGRSEMAVRLRFLQFLVNHQHLHPQEVMSLFAETDMYDLFNCVMWMKGVRADGTNIRSDGYCFYRSLYQLYLREQADYQRTVDDMISDDMLCNADPQVVNKNGEFLKFMEALSGQIKAENPLIKKMFPIQHFKLVSDQAVLCKLLAKQAGHGIPEQLYANQADVYMMKFNVSGWELLDEDRLSDLRHEDCTGDWMRFVNCSAFTTFGALTLEMVDKLGTIIPNFVCFHHNHFFVVESPNEHDFADSIDTVKTALMARILDGVSFIPEPELFSSRLEEIIRALEDDEPLDVVPFEFDKFERIYKEKYPHGRGKGPLVDLSNAPEEEILTEVSELKEKLRISEEKACILQYHVKVLGDLVK